LDPKILTSKLVGLYNRVEELPLQIAETKKDIMRCEAKLKAIQGGPIDPRVQAVVEKDPDVIALQMRVHRAQQTYIFVSGNSNDPNAPKVRDLRAELQAEKDALEKLRQNKTNQIESNRRMLEAKPIVAELEAAIKKLDQLETQYRVAKEQLERAEKQLAELPLDSEKGGIDPFRRDTKEIYDPARTDLITTDGMFSRLVQQYYLTQMELKSPPRVRILQPASTPTQKDMRKQILGTVFAGLMGYAVIALGVVAFETLTRRVSSLADLKSAGPAPVVGVIPCQPEEAVGRDPGKRAAANEAIDKLRSYVSQSWLARGATTVAVTSPLGDEGKAFTAFGLASSLSQAGYKTLLVDFDLRDPALHAYAGVPNQNGVCEILRAETDPRSAIQFLTSGLHLIPAGKWSDEARKAAVGGKLEALLAALKDPYDCVVLHGHALLTVAESVEVARRCEVVLVCARYRETKVPLLRKATDRLAAMEVPYSGVVYVGATEQEALC
jgi:Mrp family chromosome partitioning ATPase